MCASQFFLLRSVLLAPLVPLVAFSNHIPVLYFSCASSVRFCAQYVRRCFFAEYVPWFPVMHIDHCFGQSFVAHVFGQSLHFFFSCCSFICCATETFSSVAFFKHAVRRRAFVLCPSCWFRSPCEALCHSPRYVAS